MSAKVCLLLGSTALLFGGGLSAPAFSDEHQATERLNQQQLEYRVMPRPNPHRRVMWVRRWVWDDYWGDYHLAWVPRYSPYRDVSYAIVHRTHPTTISGGRDYDSIRRKSPEAASAEAAKPAKETRTASLDARKMPAETAVKPEANAAPDLTKPLTPAEIRGAIPLGKVADPKQTLASAPIKSVWGDTLGKVRGIDTSGGNVKTVEIVLAGKGAVKIDPARLKYVKSRNLLITTLSKSDAEKLPRADRS